jgi:IS30 family transposase
VLRRQFNGKSSYDLFSFAYSESLAHVLGISFVEPQKVIQSPLLLKKSFHR